MKVLITILLLLTVGYSATAQSKQAVVEEGFEMKEYFFVMLTKGSRRDQVKDTAEIARLQRGHLENINKLAKKGKIIVAGPFGDNADWRGIFIFDAASKEEVERLLASDPAIAAGRLDYDIRPWWTAKNCLFK